MVQSSQNPQQAPADDIQDSRSDQERLQGETTRIDLPEVTDIPGQEHVHAVAPLGELADTTISSDDEEGVINDDSDDDGYFDARAEEEEDTAGIP